MLKENYLFIKELLMNIHLEWFIECYVLEPTFREWLVRIFFIKTLSYS